jgi:hypothetical protein
VQETKTNLKKDKKMKITKINDTDQVQGHYLKGFVTATKAQLVEKLGEPNIASDTPSPEWWIEIDGKVAEIYTHDELTDGEMEWHIGGKDFAPVVDLMHMGFKKAVTRPEYLSGEANIHGYVYPRPESPVKFVGVKK